MNSEAESERRPLLSRRPRHLIQVEVSLVVIIVSAVTVSVTVSDVSESDCE